MSVRIHPQSPPRRGRRDPAGDVAGAWRCMTHPGTLSLPAPPPLSVYVHLPWCLKKCPYCDFNSHDRAAPTPATCPRPRYLDAVRADLEALAAAGLGPRRPDHLHRRRHAQPVLAGSDRAAAARPAHAAAAGRRLRDHDGGQPRHLRAGALPRLRAGRREPAVDRRAELQRRPAARARPRA